MQLGPILDSFIATVASRKMHISGPDAGVQVNVGGLQTLQACLTARTNIVWTAVDDVLLILISDAKFGGNYVLFSSAFGCLSCRQQQCTILNKAKPVSNQQQKRRTNQRLICVGPAYMRTVLRFTLSIRHGRVHLAGFISAPIEVAGVQKRAADFWCTLQHSFDFVLVNRTPLLLVCRGHTCGMSLLSTGSGAGRTGISA